MVNGRSSDLLFNVGNGFRVARPLSLAAHSRIVDPLEGIDDAPE
jgi:hypothetical protein